MQTVDHGPHLAFKVFSPHQDTHLLDIYEPSRLEVTGGFDAEGGAATEFKAAGNFLEVVAGPASD
jgi:hypothetical protein